MLSFNRQGRKVTVGRDVQKEMLNVIVEDVKYEVWTVKVVMGERKTFNKVWVVEEPASSGTSESTELSTLQE